MSLGFGFRERLSGTFHLFAAPLDDLAITLTLAANVDGLRQFARDKIAVLEGIADLEGLARQQPIHGTVELKLLDEGRIRYDFHFTRDDGETCRFHGQREVTKVALAESLTVLPASLYDSHDREIGRAVLRFDARSELLNSLKSFRLTSHEPWLEFLRSSLSERPNAKTTAGEGEEKEKEKDKDRDKDKEEGEER